MSETPLWPPLRYSVVGAVPHAGPSTAGPYVHAGAYSSITLHARPNGARTGPMVTP